jgi:hypothetical protein
MEARMAARGDRLRAWHEAKRAGLLPEVPKIPPGTPAAIRPLTSRQVAARLADLRCDPLAILAKLAKNTSLDPLLRAALARHLAEYQIAQPAAVHAGKSGKDVPSLGDVIADGWRKPRLSPKAKAKPGTPTKIPKSK